MEDKIRQCPCCEAWSLVGTDEPMKCLSCGAILPGDEEDCDESMKNKEA